MAAAIQFTLGQTSRREICPFGATLRMILPGKLHGIGRDDDL